MANGVVIPFNSVQNIYTRFNITSQTSLTQVWEYTAPCNGMLDLCVLANYNNNRPQATLISNDSTPNDYNIIAYGDTSRSGAVNCSVSKFYMGSGSKIYVFAKYAGSGSNFITISGEFKPFSP